MTKILSDRSLLDYAEVLTLFKRKGLTEWDIDSAFGGWRESFEWWEVKDALSGSDDEVEP